MLSEHLAALATIEIARAKDPEEGDATNGPSVSFLRSVILVRACHVAEGYAAYEAQRRDAGSGVLKDIDKRRRKVERGRRQEGDAQHAHRAAAQIVGAAAEGRRLVAGAAVHDDGGDAAHAVEKARLQACERLELSA